MLVYSFLFCGIICLIGEIIFDNSKLTFGHITSMFVVVGAVLSIFGIYDKYFSFSIDRLRLKIEGIYLLDASIIAGGYGH